MHKHSSKDYLAQSTIYILSSYSGGNKILLHLVNIDHQFNHPQTEPRHKEQLQDLGLEIYI